MRQQYHEGQKHLFRDASHKKVGGICAGIANYFETDRLYIRIAAVVTLCINPLAAIAGYGLAYFVLEEAETDFYDANNQDFDE